jgi:hypothetical protein
LASDELSTEGNCVDEKMLAGLTVARQQAREQRGSDNS